MSQKSPLRGFVATDPVTRTSAPREYEGTRYDRVTDGEVEFHGTRPGRSFLTFRLQIPQPGQAPRFVSCVDWSGNLCERLRKGDQVLLEGRFESRTAGNGKAYENFVVSSSRIERLRIRPRA